MSSRLEKVFKEILSSSPLRRYLFARSRYPYNFNAAQLCFLCQCIEDTRDVSGDIAEIGCSNGATTVFLNNYMDARNIEKKYYAVDTFSGFVNEDIEFEVTARSKAKDLLVGFDVNKKKWFDRTMQENNIARVRSIEADVNKYDLTGLAPLSFILLDVDLYRPIWKALPELFQALIPGGIMVVDDCVSGNQWDGSYQAYREFVEELNRPTCIVHDKLGVVRKGN